MSWMVSCSLGVAGGAALSGVNLALLWMTVSGLTTRRLPGLWVLVSMIGRSAVVLAGLFLLSGAGIGCLLGALVGFVAVSRVVVQRTMTGVAEEGR